MTTKKKPKRTKKTKLWLEVEYRPEHTDPESLATAVDRLLETILSTPGIMEEYGDPTFGPCWVTRPGDPIRRCNPVKSDGVSHLVLSNELSREALEAIVAKVQGLLYLDMDRAGREFWNPAKEWGGADVCQDIQDVLHQHGLVPGEEQDCMPTGDGKPAYQRGRTGQPGRNRRAGSRRTWTTRSTTTLPLLRRTSTTGGCPHRSNSSSGSSALSKPVSC